MSDFIDLSDGNGTDADADTAHASQTTPPGQLLAPLVPMTPTTAKHAFLQYPLIVDLDSSFDSNPFDQIQRIANTFDDPFESVHSKAMTTAPAIATATAAAAVQRSATTDTLIQLDEQMANSASMDAKMLTDLAALQAESQHTRAGDDEDCEVFASPTNSSKAGQSANSTAVSAAAARRTQLLKFSIANAKAAHAAATQPLAVGDGSTGSQQSTPDPKGATRWPSLVTDGFDDLMATSPGCLVDSDEPDDGSDLEQLCIPFLKRQQSGGENALGQPHADVAAVVDEGAATAAAAADDVASSCRPRAQKCLLPSTGGGGHIQQHLLDRLERHKAAAAATAAAAHSATDASPPAAMPVLLEDSASEQPVDVVAGERSAADRQHLTALLASVKQEIERFGDRTEARALLDGLQSALDRSSPVASSVSPSLQSSGASDAAASVVPEPMPTVIRQGTFTKVEAGVDKAAAEAAAVQEGIDDELDSGLQATGAADDSLSPNTSNLAHVMEQLGRMQLSRINHVLAVPGSDSAAAVPAAPTYIVVMNTPVAAAKSAHHRPKVCSTPIVQIHAASPTDDGGGCGGGGDDSPSSYLRTRTNSTRRSLSLSVRQKPSAVATAIASRAELRSRANSMAPTTPLRSTTRRSTFSSHGHTAADQPPKAFASSAAVAAAAAAAASGKLQSARRSMYDASSGRGPAASVTADRRPSPNRLLAPSPAKPLAKSPAKQRRSISFAPATTRHSAAAAPPTLLKASVMPPISQLKLRTHAAAMATAASGPNGGLRAGTAHGPIRATQPMRAIVAPRARSTTSTATATTPRKGIAPPAATAASSSSALLALPGAAGQRRTSNIGHVASATPSSKRLSTVTAAVGTAATSHHRRSMSEGKSSLALTPRQSAAHSTHFGVGSRRLSTLSGAHVRHSKENQPPK